MALLAPLVALVSASSAQAQAGPVFTETAEDTWQTNGIVNVILPVGDTIYIGGEFTELNDGAGTSVARNNLAAIDRVTGVATSFDPDLDRKVFGLTVSPDGSTLYAVGAFIKSGTANRKRVAAFDVATGALTSFNPSSPNNVVRAVATDGNLLYIGGHFTIVGGIDRTRLAAYDLATETLDTGWAPAANSTVRGIIADPSKIWVAGNFSRINTLLARGLAAVDPIDGTLLDTDHPVNSVLAIAELGDQIFTAQAGPGGTAEAFNRTTGDQQWSVRANGNLQAVTALGEWAYLGGHHDRVGGVDVGQISRFAIDTGVLDETWLPNVNGLRGVNGLARDASNLYLGGDFTFVSGDRHEGFAMFSDPNFVPPVPLAPTVTTDPVDMTVFADRDVTFEVEVSGDSPFGYQWRRDGVPIPGANSGTLTLEDVELVDSGAQFDVVVVNAVGSVTSAAATLTVEPAPVGITVEGDPTVTVIEAVEELVVLWEPVDGATSYQLRYRPEGSTRVWDSPTTDMIRTLSGLAAGVTHTVEVRAYITSWGPFTTVQAVPLAPGVDPVAPAITLDPVDVTVNDGDDAVFTAAASGNPTPTLQWQRNGVDLPGETNAALTLPNQSLADSGAAIRLIATNTAGSATSATATLTVEPVVATPVFTLDPVDVTIIEGADAVFTAAASGDPVPTLQWQRNGVDLPGETSTTLTLPSQGLVDSGATLTVIATNTVGTATSATATLTVEPTPIGITVEGDPTVTVVEAVEQLDVSWQPVDGATSYQLRYRPEGSSRVWDSPTTDMARTLSGLTAGVTHTVEVRAYTTSWGPFTMVQAVPLAAGADPVAPVFTLDPVDVTITEGADAVFTAAASGDPVPTLQWQRDGVDLPGETGSTLTLTGQAVADSGAAITVVATNVVGSVTSATATLTVEAASAAPVFTLDPVDVTITEAADAVFTAAASGDPVPTLQWQRDGVDLPGETGSTLTLTGQAVADSGAAITVVATNVVSSVTSATATLTVEPAVGANMNVLFVAGTTTPPSGDRVVRDALLASGFSITFVDDDSDLAALDTSGAGLLVLASSVVPSKVGDVFKDLAIPILTWENFLFDDLALSNSGITNLETEIEIVAPTHPAAAGYTGTVSVYTAPNRMSTGVPGADADIIAHVALRPDQPVMFAYEAGDMLVDGSTAAAARIAVFPDYLGARALTPVGSEMIVAAALSLVG